MSMRGSVSYYTAHMYSIQAHTLVRREIAQKEGTPGGVGGALNFLSAFSAERERTERRDAGRRGRPHACGAPARPSSGGRWGCGRGGGAKRPFEFPIRADLGLHQSDRTTTQLKVLGNAMAQLAGGFQPTVG